MGRNWHLKRWFSRHCLIQYRELNFVFFLKLVLSVCQKYIFKLIPQIFETTNDGAHPAGTDLSFMKIKLHFSIIEIKIYKPILTFDKKIPRKFFFNLVMIYRLSIKNFWFFYLVFFISNFCQKKKRFGGFWLLKSTNWDNFFFRMLKMKIQKFSIRGFFPFHS